MNELGIIIILLVLLVIATYDYIRFKKLLKRMKDNNEPLSLSEAFDKRISDLFKESYRQESQIFKDIFKVK